MSTWFKQFPCPLHPLWGLDDISELDLRQLKQQIDTDNNESMVVETELYRAFLEYPCGRFYNQGRVNPTEALKYLESAKKYVSTKYQDNIEAEIGYGIIIHTFHLWISSDNVTEFLLRKLIFKKDDHPDHESYIHVVHAYFLSRLGPRWRNKALLLYESALERFPNNCEWLFGKVLMIGREARQMGFIKGWNHENVQDTLRKEKGVLEKILHLDANFNLARAYYGQVLFFLGKKDEAGNEISKALQKEPQNRSIAMVAVRYHRRNKSPFIWTETILKTLLETSDTAETNYQLGLLYAIKARSVHISERIAVWETALKHFNKALDLNACHYPCYAKRAEMYALLGETQKAYDLFKEIFEHIYKDSPHLDQNEILSIETALEMRLPWHKHVFSAEEIVELSHRYITLATEQDNFDFKNEKVEKRLETLSKISCNVVHKGYVRRLATLKLADANRRLEHFEEAKQIYEKLYREDNNKNSVCPCVTSKLANAHRQLDHFEEPEQIHENLYRFEAEIVWGLGKCYFMQGFSDKAIAMATKLDMMNQNFVSASELFADVYLKRGKLELESETTLCANNKPLSYPVLHNLELAIEMRSLEASYLFLTSTTALKKKFFSLELRIPQILAKIKLFCTDFLKPNVHTHFTLKMDDGSHIIHDEKMKKIAIEKKVYELLIYDTNDTNDPSNDLLDELKDLRESRLQFELELLQRKSHETWNKSCAKSLRSTIKILRELLEHAISFYKKSVMKDMSLKCSFPVIFKEETGNINKDDAEKMINNWVKETFICKMPDETCRTILEVQPMYDTENIWLAALNELNNNIKHDNRVIHALETFDLTLKKQRNVREKKRKKKGASKNAVPHHNLRLKTEDIVRKSCEEVEKLVLFLSGREILQYVKK